VSHQPFAGITVIEFGQFIAVPYCAQLLSEGGAHVIKIESLEGDPTRHLAPLVPGETRHFLSRNRGKHSLPLDLKHPAAQPVLDRLLASADVVLTNFRPGLAKELGLEYEALSARYPRLIVGNVTAWGKAGADAGLAGMDLVVQARSGLMASNGRLRDGQPAAGEAPVIDYMCAMMLSFGIASALFRREQSGKGGSVDVSLLMAALALQNNLVLSIDDTDKPTRDETIAKLAEMRSQQVPFAEQMSAQPAARLNYMSTLYYRTYPTADGTIAIACASPALQRAFLRATGLEDPVLAGKVPRAESAPIYQDLQQQAEALLRSKPTAEWRAAFNAHGVPAQPVLFPFEVFDDPQTTANGMLPMVPHPALGPLRVIKNAVDLDGEGFRPAPVTPAMGSEVREILASLEFDPTEVEAIVESGVTRLSPPGG